MIRKIKSAFFTTLIMGLAYFLFELIQEGAAIFFLFVLFYSAIGNFLYGIPISFLSDVLTTKLSKVRFMVAGLIHIFFGFFTTLVIGELGIFAGACSLLFFLLEEWQKKNSIRSKVDRKMVVMNGLIVIGFFSVGVFGFVNYHEPITQKKTNNIYLIPKGYEGSILVLYNVQNQPHLKKEGDFTVIPIKLKNLEALEGTDIQQYGMYLTSTKDMKYGTVNDQYFYIDEKGNRTVIDDQCIHFSGSGSFTGSSGNEIKYRDLQITNNQCGEAFQFNGEEAYDTQIMEVLKYWMGYFD